MALKERLNDLVRGDTRSMRFTFDDGGNPLLNVPAIPTDITNWTLWIAIKIDASDEDGVAPLLFETTAGDHADDEELNGIMVLELPSTSTYLVPAGKYVYGIHRVIEGSSPINVTTLMHGTIIILENTVTSTAINIIPTQFTFVDQTDVEASTEITSASITVLGINFPSAITIAGDASSKYSINGAAYTSDAGTVTLNDVVTVQHVSSASASTQIDSVLTIGTVADTFSSTTIA